MISFGRGKARMADMNIKRTEMTERCMIVSRACLNRTTVDVQVFLTFKLVHPSPGFAVNGMEELQFAKSS
jgi:hypothetical protein